ncbi:DUF7310 family coiled-coil domain-containing protein [Haloterrigena alkaliphila]|uniref:DUF7310 domain-containing protein n=1 Tax=Haloterrigena alkaliphila TaxID=2816475 RepID=A0A8A2VFP1_9EURY|nr:hypothetical protein [Haloterrigena alkaliphila]QSX00934.1 hypothetical protein J0X25_08230 [Haloterrigena alkaliphila]
MSDIDRIDQRLSAVERAVVDCDVELDELADLAALAADLERLEARLEEHDRRLAELEGTVDAIDGFVGNVESVNGDVERQADAAIAAVDRLEYRIEEFERVLEKRGVSKGRDGRVETGEPSGNPPTLERPEGDETAANRSDDSSQTTRFDDHDVASSASGGTVDDAPFGEPAEAEEGAGPEETAGLEETAGTLLEATAAETGSTADGADGDDVLDNASTESDGESTTLFASLRDRLP